MTKRKLIPVKNSVVCKRLTEKTSLKENNGILMRTENVDIYEVLDVSSDDPVIFKVGDRVMSNSTGDEIEINPKETVYLFKIENIMCKVED